VVISHVIRTKIVPPRRTPRVLARPRVDRVLAEAIHYRLTILQAGAGYGKSTALSTLADGDAPLVWYQIASEDSDPVVFLLHLCHATKVALPDLQGLPIPLLESWDGGRGPVPSVEIVDQYLNALSDGLECPTLIVLDDIHLVIEAPEIAYLLDRLVGLSPADLHIVMTTRPALKMPNLPRWQARGEVLTLDQSLLAFYTEEIARLFSESYAYELASDEAERLFAVTDGWAIALQLIWQSLRSGTAVSVEDALARQATSLKSLFEVLADEILAQQPDDVQEFLQVSATLRVMTPQACDALRSASDSAAMLAYLRRQDLFVIDLDDGSLRYQYIFHQFLRQRAGSSESRIWHVRAAEYYRASDDPESTLYHLLKAEDYPRAAEFLSTYGARLLTQGRLDTLANYLEALPPSIFHHVPALLFYQGELARLHSRFQEALGWYQQAEGIWRERGQMGDVGRALRGQARVYLDTVDPARAEELLEQALRLSDRIDDRESQARLYELLAENKLNAGKPDEAERLRQQAEQLRLEGPADSQLTFRVLLRTGRLAEARRRLEIQVRAEQRDPVQVPRAHRETLLLLSLIYAFQGQADLAYQMAQQGAQRGLELGSPFITAVGYMRQGHALMLLPGAERYAQAREQFKQAIEISHTLDIPRLRVEAFWGLCRAYGYQGDLTRAAQAAEDGLDIAAQAGDEWIASLVRLALGASLTLAARYESNLDWLSRAGRGFQECSDPFGYVVARLWMCLSWFRQGQAGDGRERLAQVLPEVLAVCQRQEYDYLFTRPTLLGVPDERLLIPILILAREMGWESAYASRLLQALGLSGIDYHPGYQLRVYTLGTFQVWRGGQPIPSSGWRREKTRQLFQLFLTYRDSPLDREQIYEYLWPGAEPAVAQRNYKVALNTLLNVLEPERAPGSESAYILREGSVYGVRPGADLWLDATTFLANIHKVDLSAELSPEQAAESERGQGDQQVIAWLEDALDLYQGEFLPDALYESWAAAEREHLAVQFLRAADRLCELYLGQDRLNDTIQVCQRILAQDNCWERAYRHLMRAYYRLGDHGQVARTYQRCKQLLRQELDVSPSAQTKALYQRLISTG
jgi:ATP/maltotriose-dependent transcriptional regulator MalT/DNA-binding SARP family transcriptional activator